MHVQYGIKTLLLFIDVYLGSKNMIKRVSCLYIILSYLYHVVLTNSVDSSVKPNNGEKWYNVITIKLKRWRLLNFEGSNRRYNSMIRFYEGCVFLCLFTSTLCSLRCVDQTNTSVACPFFECTGSGNFCDFDRCMCAYEPYGKWYAAGL